MSLQLGGKPFSFLEGKRLTLSTYSFGIPDGYLAAETEDDYEFFMWFAEGDQATSDRIIFFAGPFMENEFADQFGIDAWSSFLEFEYYKGLSMAKEEEKPLSYEMYRNRNFACIIKEMSEGIYYITIGFKSGTKQLRIQIKDQEMLKEFSLEHIKAWIDTVQLAEPIDEGKAINDSTFFGADLTEGLADEICENMKKKIASVNKVFVMKKQLMLEKQEYQKVDPITAQKELITLVESFTAEIDKLMNQAFFMYRALNLANRGNENLTKIREALGVFDTYKMVEVKGPLAMISRESRLNREPNMFDLPEFTEEAGAEEAEEVLSVSQVSSLASKVAIEEAKEAERIEKEEKPLPKPDVYLAPDSTVMPELADESEVKKNKEKRKGKGWLVILLLGILAWLFVTASGIYYVQTVYMPQKHYEKALLLYDAKKYDLAYDEFMHAGDYRDAKVMAAQCQKNEQRQDEE